MITHCHCYPIISFDMKKVRCDNRTYYVVIPNVLQKSTLTIIMIFILYPNEKKFKLHFNFFFKMYTFLLCLKKKKLFNLIKITFESCNLIQSNNDALKIFSFFNHYYLFHTLSQFFFFILYYFFKILTHMKF